MSMPTLTWYIIWVLFQILIAQGQQIESGIPSNTTHHVSHNGPRR